MRDLEAYEQQLRMKEVIDGMFFNEQGQPIYSSEQALRNRKITLAIATLGHMYQLVDDPAREGDLNRAKVFATSMDTLNTADPAEKDKYSKILNNNIGGANFRKIMDKALEKIAQSVNILHTHDHREFLEAQRVAHDHLNAVLKIVGKASLPDETSADIPIFIQS